MEVYLSSASLAEPDKHWTESEVDVVPPNSFLFLLQSHDTYLGICQIGVHCCIETCKSHPQLWYCISRTDIQFVSPTI